MKNLSFTRLVLFALFIFNSLKIFSAVPDFQVNGIYYKITSIEDRECGVYGIVNPQGAPDKLVIPSEVKFNGTSFTVVSVWGDVGSRNNLSRFATVKEIILPNTVKMIGYSAFYNVRSLEKIQMDGVENIADNAFEGCENLKIVSTALNRLRYIGQSSFFNCRNLEKFIIPSSCKKVGSAFGGYKSPKFTLIIEDSDEPLLCPEGLGFHPDYPRKKMYIGRNLWSKIYKGEEDHNFFYGDIYHFREMEYGDKVTAMLGINLKRYYSGDLENLPFKITIGASIKEVPDFSNDGILIKSLYLVSAKPPHVKGTFSNRTYLHGTLYVPKGSLLAYKNAPVWKNFLNIQEYETDRTIAANKEYFTQLKKEEAQKAEAKHKEEEEVQRKTDAREEAAKRTMDAMEAAERYAREVEDRMNAKQEAKQKEREEQERKAKAEAEERAKQKAELYAQENPIIPEGTTEIPANAYKGKNIRSITIPNSVIRIGSNAFEGCTKLMSVTIQNGVVTIEDGAFAGCTTLSSVNIGNRVESIGDNAFANCKFLTSIKLPNSISTIGRNAFGGCVNLNEITIGSSVTSLGYGVFEGCLKLKAINVSEENKSYSSYDDVLYNKDKSILIRCPRWKKEIIRIPVSIEVIVDDAFKGCSYIRYITIPKSAKSIGKYAFMGCKNLEITIPKKWKGKVYLSDCKSVKYY